MFNFFKKKGKAETAETPEQSRKLPTADTARRGSVDTRAPRNDNDVTNEKSGTLRKDVVNLLIPEINYNQKTGVGALLQIMAGKRKRNRRKARADSYRASPQKETQNLQRSNSDTQRTQDATPTPDENTRVGARTPSDPADFVKALVLQKYASKPETKQQHVSLVYVSDEPDWDEKRHAEALLREIARSIDCTIDEINEKKQMGNGDSKPGDPVYESVADRQINTYKNDLKGELDRLLQDENETNKINEEKEDGAETESLESPTQKKKSNLKLPKSDTEGYSDDDRSDNGKKRVTFRKHVIFDDGEQQTDNEINSSFESLTSEEEESEYLEDAIPDNDELLGGVVVSRDDENKTVISVSEDNEAIKIKVECFDDGLKRISSDNSDSGFIEMSDKTDEENEKSMDVEGSEVSESESEEEIVEVIEVEEEESAEETVETEESATNDDMKTLVTQENKFQSQVAALTELADTRCGEAERAKELITAYRKEIEEKDQEIEQLKCDLAAAYKESELVRQRSRSLEEELSAARSCSADLADQLQRRNDESLRQLRAELDDALTRRAELESKLLELEKDKERLEEEKLLHAQKAQEALAAAEANTAKWRAAHEAARSQAAARAERMLADCEWKMRELEKRARDAEKEKKELTQTVEKLQNSPPTPSHIAELQQLRGLAAEQQRSVQSLSLQLQKVERREEALKLEVHRLKELLERESQNMKAKEEHHLQAMQRLEQQHTRSIEALKSEQVASSSAAAAARAAGERAAAERTRAALAQLRAEHELEARAADRKLREVTTRFESLKEVLANKEAHFEHAIAEAHSKADWDVMQLRHLLDKADISYANNMEKITEKFEKEKELLTKEWTEKLRAVEEQALTAADEARRLLETTRSKMLADRHEQITKLKEQHRTEMDKQWEQFMTDKENCLSRMKTECRQEGEEERIKRERELLKEIADLKSQVQSKAEDFDNLEAQAAACGRTLATTEQELREALAREKEVKEKRGEDAAKLKQVEKASREQIEHLNRKCSCLRKLFDDMRARLAARERSAEQEARAKEKELHYLRAEVARLTKILVEQSSPRLGTRTRADGCENTHKNEESFFSKAAPLASETQPNAPRRKGGTLRTPELTRKRLTLPELQPLPPDSRRDTTDVQNGRRRAKSVDLPAVQVPIRIKQLEEKTKEKI